MHKAKTRIYFSSFEEKKTNRKISEESSKDGTRIKIAKLQGKARGFS